LSPDATVAPHLRITVPARGESMMLLRHVVRGFREAYAIRADRMDDIVLAISEAATNATVHAYGSRRGTITVFARVDDGLLHVLVRDHGTGIAPAARHPVPGHGLALIAHVAASMTITGGPGGTDVLMTFAVESELEMAPLDDLGAGL
jgi:anti-sigma regulatory factor (Ser/Thr protein kinase)